jgi:chorismate--pyruvate lyase
MSASSPLAEPAVPLPMTARKRAVVELPLRPATAARTVPWRNERRFPGPVLAPVRNWLLDDGSLTGHLINTGRRFSVQRWAQRWEYPAREERLMLGMRPRERAMVRRVVLQLDGSPVVYARSVFPARSLSGPLRRLRGLMHQSLGAFLFARPDMRRSPFEIALLSGDDAYIPGALRQREPAWARRSCFVVAGRPLLVSEVFLAGFPTWSATTPLHRSRRGQVDATIGGHSRR